MKITHFQFALAALIATFTASCNAPADKPAQLKKLKEQQVALAKEIAGLEKELAGTDTTEVVGKSKEVVIAALAPRRFERYVQTQGAVKSTDNIMVSAQSMGLVTNVYVREGDAVAKGQTLAQIDNSLIAKGIDEAKSSMSLVNTIFEKQQKLWDQKVGTEIQYLQAKNNKEGMEKRLASLYEQLDMAKIKSPINGTIDMVNIKIGENAAPGFPAFRVINGNDLQITAEVSEAYMNSIKKGNKAEVSFTEYDQKITGQVTFVGRTINPLSRSFTVEVKLPSSNDLRPNMTALIRIIFKSEEAVLCVPVNVVQDINGEKVVYIAETNGKQMVARKKVVTINGVYDNMARVVTGLNTGDKIITVGYQGLNDGELIKI